MNRLILMSVMITLNLLSTIDPSSAQEAPCKKCNLPPQAIGAFGITCEIAEKAFAKALPAKDSYGFFDGPTTYHLNSEVYCKPGFGYFAQGGSTSLIIRVRYERNPLDQDLNLATTANLFGIMGIGLKAENLPIAYDEFGAAWFSRNQWFYNRRFGWHLPERRTHYYSYQCKIPARNEDGLICKVFLDGRIEIGYQIYLMRSSYGASIPEGVLY